ncbi:MAG: TonB-dependent receptor [Opitutaceae bacterium]|nr:TonB-dependent receptor [Opitutaceae bacterium]
MKYSSCPTILGALLRHAPRLVRWICFSSGFLLAATVLAAPAATGVIEGRVFNPGTGEYLEFVRITVEGTALETFTDSAGEFRLGSVPAGAVKVTAFRTGVPAQTHTVTVTDGQTVRQNFELSYAGPANAARPGERAIKLDAFVVETSKQMDGAAIAINTQRFAANTMNVVAANEFGPVADGGVGEVLKSVSGISIARGGFGDAYQVSLNGAPPRNVPITVGGISLANSASGLNRFTGMQQSSINNFSRIEVVYTPTPETSAAALAGTVNMVPLSAFERSRPLVNLNVSLMMRDNDRSFRRTPGPLHEPARKVHPGSDFSAIVPVNDRFGFTLSGSASALYTAADFSQNNWAGASAATNGTTLPDTTPDKPYLTVYQFRDRPVFSKRITLGSTADYKLSSYDRVSFSILYGYSDAQAYQRQVNFTITGVAPGNFTTRSTRGNPGAGSLQLVNNYTKLGGPVITPALTYRHDGPVWKAEASAGLSRSGRFNQNMDRGAFSAVNAQRTNVTIAFDDINYLRPGRITTTDGTTGAPIDPFNIGSYGLTTSTGVLLKAETYKRTAFANLRRDFFQRVPVTIKAGFDVRDERFTTRTLNPTYTYVGADGRAATADDNASVILDPSFSQRTPPFGFPRMDVMSNQKLLAIQRATPAYFTTNEATTHTATVNNSKYAEELVSAGYVRGDVQFFDRRLKLVGGFRVEQTNAKGEGPLIDATRNFQRDSAGRFVLGANGRPLPITTDPVAAVRLTNVDRGLKAEKEYVRWFPSLNATYNVRDNLIARAGYYWSIGRPDYNQYAGGLTLPDQSQPPSPTNRISVNNIGVKAWTAKTLKVSLEYYFERVGLISVSAYQRDIENFFGSTVFAPSPEFLQLYNLDAATYGGYDVATQFNLTTPVKQSGVDLNYKQALTFLPHWARGVQVFANLGATTLTGDNSGSFAGYIPRTYNWGVSLTRPRYNVRANWNYSGRARQSIVAAGRSIEPGTYTWGSKRLILDLSGELRFYKTWAAFMNLSNFTDEPIDIEIAGPSTPDHAQFRSRTNYGAQWTFGLKTTF